MSSVNKMTLFCLFIFFVPGAKAQVSSDTKTLQVNSETFRHIFYRSILKNKSMDLADYNKLVFTTLPEMFNEDILSKQRFNPTQCALTGGLKNQEAPTEFLNLLCSYSSYYQNLTTTLLYQNTVDNSVSSTASAFFDSTYPSLENTMPEKDILIVIVPGIFGEFINKRAFEEVFETPSIASQQWQSLMINKTDCKTQDVCDSQNLLAKVTLQNRSGAHLVPMKDLLHIASIDQRGKSLAKVLLFHVEGMSLESLGDSADRASIFNRRLEKYFSLIQHVPKNIILVGYSRGTPFALDMLSQAQHQNKPWLKNVRGLVSLGGVIFGSALADQATLDTTSKQYKQMSLLRALSQTLHEVPLPPAQGKIDSQLLARLEIFQQNNIAWFKFLQGMARLEAPMAQQLQSPANLNEYLMNEIEKIQAWIKNAATANGGVDPASSIQLALHQAHNFFGLLDNKISLDSLNPIQFKNGQLIFEPKILKTLDVIIKMNSDWSIYNINIIRFKALAEAVITGTSQLSTNDRIQWWKTHNIPIDIGYYSISGSMDYKDSDLVNNKIGYNPGSPDDKTLTQGWEDYKNVALNTPYQGISLNDSQVATFKTHFWPHLIEALNPKNANIQSTNLAILGTHHWGFALPVVNPVKKATTLNTGILEKNPFPRAELLKTIAITLSIKIQEEK